MAGIGIGIGEDPRAGAKVSVPRPGQQSGLEIRQQMDEQPPALQQWA